MRHLSFSGNLNFSQYFIQDISQITTILTLILRIQRVKPSIEDLRFINKNNTIDRVGSDSKANRAKI